jgi:hypothetical protein
MSTLKKPKFKELPFSSFGGAPLLLTLPSGIISTFHFTSLKVEYTNKEVSPLGNGVLFVIGLISRCGSCLKIIDFYKKESLLQKILNENITQSVFSRFLVSPFQWNLFNLKRVASLQKKRKPAWLTVT